MLYEVSLTRVFSVLTWHHFVYMIVGTALLGFGAAGTAMAQDVRFARAEWTAGQALAFAVLGPATLRFANRLELEPLLLGQSGAEVASLAICSALVAEPFF